VEHDGPDPLAIALTYISWLLDSLFNDVCVVFVGFGPIAAALQTVGAAAIPDVPGDITQDSGAAPVANVVGVATERQRL